jgi:hypothetical protein
VGRGKVEADVRRGGDLAFTAAILVTPLGALSVVSFLSILSMGQDWHPKTRVNVILTFGLCYISGFFF